MLDLLLAHDSWLIAPEALDHLASRAEAYGRGLIKEQSTPQIPLTEIRDGIAEIAIHGTMARRPNDLTRWLTEATDTEQVLEAVRLAAADDSIESILLDIDSPGGSVAGVPELAEAVAEASRRKPIYAWTGGRMASAAYWIASQADGIFASPSARVGSIGVVVPFLDRSKAMEKDGLKMEVFASGKYKAAGMPGVSLTDEQRASIQADVEELFGDFKSAVLAKGRKISEESMQGQMFSARQASARNLSRVEKNKEAVRRKLKAMTGAAMAMAVDKSRTGKYQTMDSTEETLQAAIERLQQLEASQSALVEFQATLDTARTSYEERIEKLAEDVTALTELAEQLAIENEQLKTKAEEIDARIAARAAQIAADSGAAPLAVSPVGDDQPQKALSAAEIWNRQFAKR
jgi:signal peptide peptidase SppA